VVYRQNLVEMARQVASAVTRHLLQGGMAAPTQLDRIEAKLSRIDLEQQQQNALLNAISLGVQIMSQTADSTAASVDNLDAKVDTLLALVTPSIQALRDALAAAQAQVDSLQAGDAADAAKLSGTIAAADAEAAKVQAAIDALTPPATT
jgi:hypothetical protein